MTQLSPVIRVAAEEWVPYTKLFYDNGTQDIAGPMKHFLVEFCRMLGVRYEVVRPPDGLWGKPLENGSYSGMMGLLMTGQADFALGPFVYSWWREALADLTTPFYYIQYHVLSPRPVVPSDPAGIVKTFSFQVWLLVAACLAVVGVAMMGMMWVANKFQWNTRVAPAWWAAEWSFQGAVQQSTPWLPGNASGRVLVTVWLLSALVIATTYKGNITAMLTLPKTDVPIDSIADLAYQDRLPWKLEFGGIDKIMMVKICALSTKKKKLALSFLEQSWG
ncbi:glutamate receptor ionotropic, delta-1-like [Scylla paramamosain]|uniref:glutamate receptor ionotropic, delta-1-like n=1 Tax=Scylla paramamosain TaxID=85552 RepID=UPI0030836018